MPLDPSIYVKLFDILVDRFTSSDWQKLALAFVKGGLDQFSGSDPRLSFLDHIRTRNLLPTMLLYFKRDRSDIYDDLSAHPDLGPIVRDSLAPEGMHIEFVNRETEKSDILYPTASAYHLIHAPAGYGKTELLKDLRLRFEHDGWISAYIGPETYASIESLVRAIVDELKITSSVVGARTDRETGHNVGAVLSQRFSKVSERPERTKGTKGIALLIDTGDAPQAELLRIIIEDFVPGIQEELFGGLAYFRTYHNAFRAVIATRYDPVLAQWAYDRNFGILRLGPFDYNVIRMTLGPYVGNTQYLDEYVLQLAAHILHFTGGHPKCIARILEAHNKLERPRPDRFFLQGKEPAPIVHAIVDQTIWDTLNGIRNELKETLVILCVYRTFDHEILKSLMQRKLLDDNLGPHDFADELTGSRLISRNVYLLHDDITRRLLNIYLRRSVSSEEYQQQCELAKMLYAERLADPLTRTPVTWAIEYLFQCLQLRVNEIHDTGSLLERQNQFFELDVPAAIDSLKRERDWKLERNALVQAIRQDWEFAFTVNYYLRNGIYNQAPLDLLLRKIATS